MSRKFSCLSLCSLVLGLYGILVIPAYAQVPNNKNNLQPQNVEAQDDLLQKFVKFSSLPASEKKGYFVGAPASEKSDLWKMHLALYLAKHSELSKEQKEVITDAISLMKPELFDTAQDNPSRGSLVVAVQAIKMRALQLFTKRQVAEIFYSLGGEKCETCANSDSNPIKENLGVEPVFKLPTENERTMPTGISFMNINGMPPWHTDLVTLSLTRAAAECSCNFEGCWLLGYDFCGKRGDCSGTILGCGLFWLDPCTGNYCGVAPIE